MWFVRLCTWFSESFSWVSRLVILSVAFDCYFYDFSYKNLFFIFSLLISLFRVVLFSISWLFLSLYDWSYVFVFYNSYLVFYNSNFVACSVDLNVWPVEDSSVCRVRTCSSFALRDCLSYFYFILESVRSFSVDAKFLFAFYNWFCFRCGLNNFFFRAFFYFNFFVLSAQSLLTCANISLEY